MRHAIDPKIDCVFRTLLGTEPNSNLLLHFLNAFLANDLPAPLTSVDILESYKNKAFYDDDVSVVAVNVRDHLERCYQIEVQLNSHKHLTKQFLYDWSYIHSQQLQDAKNYRKLMPTFVISLLTENLIEDDQIIHDFRMLDQQGIASLGFGGYTLVEIKKFNNNQIDNEQQRWIKFFNEGVNVVDNALPNWMQTPEMKQAMNTLSYFSENQQQYFRYKARLDYIRERNTINQELIDTRVELEAEKQRAKAERQRADAALAEIEQLKALLAKKN